MKKIDRFLIKSLEQKIGIKINIHKETNEGAVLAFQYEGDTHYVAILYTKIKDSIFSYIKAVIQRYKAEYELLIQANMEIMHYQFISRAIDLKYRKEVKSIKAEIGLNKYEREMANYIVIEKAERNKYDYRELYKRYTRDFIPYVKKAIREDVIKKERMFGAFEGFES